MTATIEETRPAEEVAPRRPPRARLVVALLLVVLLAAAAGFGGWKLRAESRLAGAEREAAAAGQVAVADILSYDHTTLDADLAKAKAHLSPAFAEEFDTVATQSVRPVAARDQVVTSASVPAVSVVSGTERKVELLMFVDQLTSSAKEQNVVNLSRLAVTMVASGDRWLVEDLRAI